MKKSILAVMSVFVFLASMSTASAEVFIPEAVVFESDQDGVWEFPAVTQATFLGTEAAQDWLTINFVDGLLEEFEMTGEGAIESDAQNTFVRLNNPVAPQYVVNNRLKWVFQVSESRHVWLRFEYRLWSQETERGFDDPALVLYLGNTVIAREQVFEYCAEAVRIETVCPWRTKRLYLGNLNGQQTLTFLAGEMGDLQKPTGVDIRALKLETQVVSVSPTPTPTPTTTATPTPTPTAVPTSTPTPTPISTSQAIVPTPTSTPSPISSPLAAVPETKYVAYSEPESGKVLGASDQKAAEQEILPIVNSDEETKKLIFQPWLWAFLSVGVIGGGLAVWQIRRRRHL